MYRLLIVDDEPTIRKGMMSCIDWGKYGIGRIMEASNGTDALKEALTFYPHILLTDIRMPVMDGIELSYLIREKLPDCKIIVMSGYDEFEYAKKLMRIKVTEYLLKPVDENELVNVISRLVDEIREEEAYKSSRQSTNQLLQKTPPQQKVNLHKGKRNFVKIALRFIDERYNEDISLSDVADVAFVTPNYLSRIFKEEMKMNFIDYLNLLRVEKAKQLLLHTNLKSYEIAERVGYTDYKYFSTIFKKITGFSPREYRRN